ncbi:MAG: hypothetical protein ACRD2G_05670 [Terriglobia bacterium]
MIGVKSINTDVDRPLPSGLYDGAKVVNVGFIVKPVGEPDAGNPHVRFDERGWETEPHSRPPRPSSTLLI